MTGRRQPATALVVTDLDGTLVRGNTLHIYLRCGLTDCLRRHRYGRALSITALMCLRRLRIISHRTMKFGCLKRIEPDPRLRLDFTRKVEARIDPSVTELLDRYRLSGHSILLATAAPVTYIPWIWQGDFVATPTEGNPERFECRGNEKVSAVREYMRRKGIGIIQAVITDHSDDLPLLTEGARETFLVNPSPSTLMAVKLAGLNPVILP